MLDISKFNSSPMSPDQRKLIGMGSKNVSFSNTNDGQQAQDIIVEADETFES